MDEIASEGKTCQQQEGIRLEGISLSVGPNYRSWNHNPASVIRLIQVTRLLHDRNYSPWVSMREGRETAVEAVPRGGQR